MALRKIVTEHQSLIEVCNQFQGLEVSGYSRPTRFNVKFSYIATVRSKVDSEEDGAGKDAEGEWLEQQLEQQLDEKEEQLKEQYGNECVVSKQMTFQITGLINSSSEYVAKSIEQVRRIFSYENPSARNPEINPVGHDNAKFKVNWFKEVDSRYTGSAKQVKEKFERVHPECSEYKIKAAEGVIEYRLEKNKLESAVSSRRAEENIKNEFNDAEILNISPNLSEDFERPGIQTIESGTDESVDDRNKREAQAFLYVTNNEAEIPAAQQVSQKLRFLVNNATTAGAIVRWIGDNNIESLAIVGPKANEIADLLESTLLNLGNTYTYSGLVEKFNADPANPETHNQIIDHLRQFVAHRFAKTDIDRHVYERLIENVIKRYFANGELCGQLEIKRMSDESWTPFQKNELLALTVALIEFYRSEHRQFDLDICEIPLIYEQVSKKVNPKKEEPLDLDCFQKAYKVSLAGRFEQGLLPINNKVRMLEFFNELTKYSANKYRTEFRRKRIERDIRLSKEQNEKNRPLEFVYQKPIYPFLQGLQQGYRQRFRLLLWKISVDWCQHYKKTQDGRLFLWLILGGVFYEKGDKRGGRSAEMPYLYQPKLHEFVKKRFEEVKHFKVAINQIARNRRNECLSKISQSFPVLKEDLKWDRNDLEQLKSFFRAKWENAYEAPPIGCIKEAKDAWNQFKEVGNSTFFLIAGQFAGDDQIRRTFGLPEEINLNNLPNTRFFDEVSKLRDPRRMIERVQLLASESSEEQEWQQIAAFARVLCEQVGDPEAEDATTRWKDVFSNFTHELRA